MVNNWAEGFTNLNLLHLMMIESPIQYLPNDLGKIDFQRINFNCAEWDASDYIFKGDPTLASISNIGQYWRFIRHILEILLINVQ